MSSGARSLESARVKRSVADKRDGARFAANGINLSSCVTYMRTVSEPRTGRVARNARHVDSRIRIDRLSRTSSIRNGYARADVNVMRDVSRVHTCSNLLLKVTGLIYQRYNLIPSHKFAIKGNNSGYFKYRMLLNLIQKQSYEKPRLFNAPISMLASFSLLSGSVRQLNDTFIKFSAVQM